MLITFIASLFCPAPRLVGSLTKSFCAIFTSHTFKVSLVGCLTKKKFSRLFPSCHAISVCAFILMFENAARTFTVSGKVKPEEVVVATLSSLPDEVVDTVGTVLPSEDSVSERRRKLEFLEMQEELIKVMYT